MKKNISKFLVIFSLIVLVALPIVSLAQTGGPAPAAGRGACQMIVNPKLGDLFGYVTCIISRSVIPLLFALALAVFIWGVIQYVINASEEKERTRGKQFMIWGIIALTVMFSIWGLVRIFTNTFSIDFGIPQVKQKY